MTELGRTLDRAAEAQRRAAIRHLLVHPLTGQREHPDAYALLARHRRPLVEWFADHTGWQLVVDESGGFARLHKTSAHPDATRPATTVSRSSRPFDRRRYALLCLTLTVLDDRDGQISLKYVSEGVVHRSRELEGVDAFDPTSYGERRALVDVLKLLAELGVIAERDGATERYLGSETGDALYDIDDRRIAQLVSAPSSPSLVDDPADLPVETYPDSDEGARLQARHRVMRRLLDDPVVYYDDLDERETDWVTHALRFVHDTLDHDVGLIVERRAEGLLAVDPDREVTDETFPDGSSTVKHAALLFAEVLTDRARTARAGAAADGATPDPPFVLSDADGEALAGDLVEAYADHCNWANAYTEGDGAKASLAGDALGLLERFGLVTRRADDWVPRPALARFAPAAPGSDARSDTGASNTSGRRGDVRQTDLLSDLNGGSS